MDSPRIIVLGSVNVDLVIRGPRLPEPGETVLDGQFYRAHGGKGANQAVAAARAAVGPVAFIGVVGDDAFGREALENFAGENLDCRYIKTVSGQPTGVALIMVDRLGENLISVASGANLHLTSEDVDAVPDELFRDASVFLTCLESPLETVGRGLRRAKAAGLLTILNPAPANRDICTGGLLELVDFITPNQGEAAALAGIGPDGQSTPTTAARKLQQLGCRGAIVTLGSRGCLVVQADECPVPGHPVEAVDATAAGDAFNGALAVALAEGRTPIESARWANQAAAIAVTRPGAQPSLPTRAEIDSAVE